MQTIAVIEAGFSGTMAAVHVLRMGNPETIECVFLAERSRRDVGGVAYETGSASHTLNVPAGRMSAFENEPDHFLRWARLRDPSLTGGSFVPRRRYGEYLSHVLESTRRAAGVPLRRIAAEAVAAAETTNGVTVRFADGRVVSADQAVLAIGNFPPAALPPSASLASSLRYAADPWSPDALEGDRREPVLLLGTGPTMLDLALALRDADQQATIYALSRRGLLPQAHRISASPPPHLDPPVTLERWPSTAVAILRELRREIREAGARGIDWREVVTSIRHDTTGLWQRLDESERERFLRHLRPYWETHRHRSSPETALAIDSLIAAGSLRVLAGNLESLDETRNGVAVRFRRRGGDVHEELHVGKVINCTGPDTDLTQVRDPLVASMREAGSVRPDALGLGLDADDDGRLLDARGRASRRLSLVGPLRKGRLWESTAVPELRLEAERLARRLVGDATRPAGGTA